MTKMEQLANELVKQITKSKMDVLITKDNLVQLEKNLSNLEGQLNMLNFINNQPKEEIKE